MDGRQRTWGWSGQGAAAADGEERGANVSIYKYRVELNRGEEFSEEGTVIARDESEAKEKLRILRYRAIHLKKLSGFNAFFKKFTADVR